MDTINWLENPWFAKYQIPALTDEFKEWWTEFYGSPADYDDQDEYWTRCAFALMGWLSARK
jgi:hypothetical protein